MGTLNDGIAWLNATLGDKPRVNSLIKIGQTKGLVVTSGRGRGSPAMMMTDYAAVLCMALMHDGPTRAPEVVSRMWQLPLSLVTLDPGDGTPRQIEPEQVADDNGPAEEGELPRPGFFVTHYLGADTFTPKMNVILALTALFEGANFDGYARRHDFHTFDRLELIEAHDRRQVSLTLHGPAYGHPYTEAADAHMLKLTFGDIYPGGDGALRTTRTLYGDALNALARIARRAD